MPLDIVEFDNEDGTGPGVVLDYFTQAFKKQMETYGTCNNSNLCKIHTIN
jgi:hypothetical protein